MIRNIFCFLALSVLLVGCPGVAEKAPIASLVQSPPSVPSPNRDPIRYYEQSLMSIPGSVNDPAVSLAAPWVSSNGATNLKYMWSFEKLGSSSLFNRLTLPAQEIIVAVVDTGVDYDHEDLQGRLWKNSLEGQVSSYANKVDDDADGFVDDELGWDFVNNTNNPADDYGHGTHIAGTIGAIGNNSLGIIGIAPWVRIMAVKVCGSQGTCSGSDVRAGIQYAVDHGAKIINLSLGAPAEGSDSDAFNAAIQNATNHGVLVVVAAGNSAMDAGLTTPANAPDALVVAAYRSDERICSFSNYGWKLDVAGPGCALSGGVEGAGILSVNSKKCGTAADRYCSSRTALTGGYALKSGTSMASPHIAGLAAVAWTINPSLTPSQVRQAVLRSSVPIHLDQRNADFGVGYASALNLIDEVPVAVGVKIRTPIYGARANTHAVKVQIEPQASAVSWKLKIVQAPTGASLDLTGGVELANGTVLANQQGISVVNVSPNAAGDWILILEAFDGTRKFYDTNLIRR